MARRPAILAPLVFAGAVLGPVLGPTLTPRAAAAQDTTDAPPAEQAIQVVERGFFLEADFGVTGFLVTSSDDLDRSYGAATTMDIIAGYDVLPILSVGLGVRGMGLGISRDFALGQPRGDLFVLSPLLSVRFAVLTTERNFVWVRGDVGLGLGFPGEIDGVDYGGVGPLASVMVGFERFTKLRHFSIGANLGATILTAPSLGVGITFLPHVKYTF